MTGIGMSEEAAWLNLSDGGHIENLAVYELLRRRSQIHYLRRWRVRPGIHFPTGS